MLNDGCWCMAEKPWYSTKRMLKKSAGTKKTEVETKVGIKRVQLPRFSPVAFTQSSAVFLNRITEAPRSTLRGITELKHSELPEIFLRLPLPLHIPFNGLPVGPFPYCGHIVPIGPKLPTPQYPLHRGLSAKDLPRRDALE